MKKLIETIVTIDPGYSGAIVIYSKDDFQILKNDNRRTFTQIFETLKQIKSNYENIMVFIEKVGMFKADSNEDGKRFNINKMVIHYNNFLNALDVLKIPYLKVSAQKWQRYLNLYKKGEDKKERKNRYKAYSQGIFKNIEVTTINQDALCLVCFAKRLIEYDRSFIDEFGNNIDQLKEIDYVQN